jgi:hypothetical protein
LKYRKPIIILFIYFISGCSTSIIVEDWNKVPRESILEVHSKDGNIYELEEWEHHKDGSLSGKTMIDAKNKTGITIQAKSIDVVYIQDPRINQIVTITGAIIIAVAVFGIYFVIKSFPNITFGL